MHSNRLLGLALVCAFTCGVASASAQDGLKSSASDAALKRAAAASAAALPPGYVVGAGDLLSIVFWRDKDMSADVTVRPDGKISLPLINDITAAGYAPEELRTKITEAASKFVTEPDVTVVVREIRSRNVYILGNVLKAGAYPLNSDMNVLQLIALAGGTLEYAKTKEIKIHRPGSNGQEAIFTFNFNDVVQGKRTTDNIVLKPNDTVYVP
jgi:polysaccharide biosynthesis/export protein